MKKIIFLVIILIFSLLAAGEGICAEAQTISASGTLWGAEGGPVIYLAENTENPKMAVLENKAYCGDGSIQSVPESSLGNDDFISEQCDDGNSEDGDGCNSNCQIEVISSPDPQPDPQPQPNPIPGTGGGSSGGGGGGGGGNSPAQDVQYPQTVEKATAENTATTTLNNSTNAVGGDEDAVDVLGEELENYLNIESLFGVSGDVADIVSYNEASAVYSHNEFVSMDEAGASIYKKINYDNFAYVKDKDKYNKAYFIFYGTPTTKSLGAGERGGALASYIYAFRKIPTTVLEWQDVIKIANGRWPSEKNENAEKSAKEKFKKIYLREASMENANDNAAVTIMAYGLRPANRNFESEKAAIKSFEYIFKKSPENASDWDIVRAIAYSGAKR